MSARVSLAIAVTITFLASLSCTDKRSTSSSSNDTTPPAGISDLAVVDTTSHSVTLRWTAPGDDGQQGTVACYDIRWARTEATFANWDSATAVGADLQPEESGSLQYFTVDPLLPETEYCFCLRTADEAENWSVPSNIVSVSTLAAEDSLPPTAVTDLVASDPTDNSLRLSWTAPADSSTGSQVARYDIRFAETEITEVNWGSAASVPILPDPAQPGSEESIVVTGLASGTAYYFALKSEDSAANWSSLSNIVLTSTHAFVDTFPPIAVTDLVAADPTEHSIRLSWTAPTDSFTGNQVAQYDIRYAETEIREENWTAATQVANIPAPAQPGAQESVVIDELAEGTLYYCALRSQDSAGNWSSLSNSISASTNAYVDTFPPTPIVDLVAVAPSDNSIRLSWTAPADSVTKNRLAHYEIRYAETEVREENWSVATQVPNVPDPAPPGTQESLVVSGLTANTLYYFAVKSEDSAANWSDLSNIVSASTHAFVDTFPPAAVTDLIAGDPTDHSIRLSWTAPADSITGSQVARYDIRHAETEITEVNWGSAAPVPILPDPAQPGSEENIVVEGLAPGTLYYFAVKSEDSAANWSSLSNIASQFTSDPATWQRVIGCDLEDRAVAVTEMPSGGYGLLGTSEISPTQPAIYVGNLDPSGSVLWESRLAAYSTKVAALAAGLDGSLVIIGTQEDCCFLPLNHEIKLIKIGASGAQLWSKIIGSHAGQEDLGSDIIRAHGDGYLIGGTFKEFTSHFVAKIDDDGSIVWQREYGLEYPFHRYTELAPTEDGGYIVCGDDELGIIHLIKIDSQGETMWETEITGMINTAPSDIIALPDGYLVAGRGYEATYSVADGYLLRTDLDGNVVWERTPGGSECDYLTSVVAMQNGDFLAVGGCHNDIYLVRVDDEGQIVWEKTFGGSEADWGNDIIATSDGGFLIVGTTRSYGAGGSDIYLIKLDANGEL